VTTSALSPTPTNTADALAVNLAIQQSKFRQRDLLNHYDVRSMHHESGDLIMA